MPLPSNGVIYVDNSLSGSCSGGFVRTQNYSGTGRGAPTSCENAWVSGPYSSDLTIAADNDVIVEDDITRGGDGVLLGLIANNFVRVYHPVAFGSGTGGCENTGDTGGRAINAAILAQALFHPRQLVLRRSDGRPDRGRGDLAEVPRPGGHG
jgi:hypothetical protein